MLGMRKSPESRRPERPHDHDAALVLDAVSDRSELTVDWILSEHRSGPKPGFVSQAREMVGLLLREDFELSLGDIGEVVNLGHSATHTMLQRASRRVAEQPHAREMLQELRRDLGSSRKRPASPLHDYAKDLPDWERAALTGSASKHQTGK